ncbi:MAG: large repetitive protein [Thermoanaerobaculia bacterium]|jgi:protocatechuate 3,4-dioxygenase beta subunit|nr:large repetitive protein [Thermoanaerobaculia bacterium]
MIRPIDMRTPARLLLATLVAAFLSSTALGAIKGTVVDSDDKPVAGATIRAYAAEDSATLRAKLVAGKIAREPLATAQSSDNGSFSIDVKGTTAVDLVIDAAGHPRITIPTVDGDDVGGVVLGPQPVSKFRVTSGGKPVANAVLFSGSEIRQTDAAGEASAFGIPMLYVIHPDYAISGQRQTFSPSTLVYEIKLSRGVELRGNVVNAAGPVAHAAISINGWPLSETADDGSFVVAHAPENWQSISAVRGNEIGIATRPKSGPLSIHLAAGSTFTGTLRDAVSSTPVVGARIGFGTAGDALPMSAVSDAKGQFTFGPLLPRSYQIEGTHPSYTITGASVTVPQVTTRTIGGLPFARARGRVLDEEKKPVAGAVVNAPVINSPRRTNAITNAAGEFSIRVMVSPNAIALPIYALKRGYAGGMTEARKWQPGETRNDIVIIMAHGFPATVRVLDRQHQPVARAYVNLTRTGDNGQLGFFFPAECADPSKADCRRTGADGSVVFRTSEGPHSVFVTGDEVAPKRIPSVALTARSEPVVIEVDHSVTISGRVVRPDGTPVSEGTVEMPLGSSPVRNATIDASGAFTIVGIAAGATSLTAYSTDRRLSSAAVPVTAPAKNVTITMPLGARIEGRVIDRGTKQPVTDFTVSLPQRPGPRPGPPSMPQQVHSDDGSYAIENVTPGVVQIAVSSSGYVPGTRNDISVDDGKTVSGIDVQLDRGANISGRVTSGGEPVAGVRIQFNDTSRMPMFSGATTDADGNYSLDGIAEGERTLQFQRAGFVVQRKTVEVTAGKDVRLDVTLDRGGEIRGQVTDRTGHNIPGASVTVNGDRNTPGTSEQTDLDGSFVIQGIAAGNYRVIARKEGYVSGDANDVTVPQARPLIFTLDGGATISGRVTGLPPEELSQVTVSGSGGTTRNQTPVDSAGNFTLRGLPDGRVQVNAYLASGGQNRMAPPKIVVVENGAAPPVEIDFSAGIIVNGHVTRAGAPVTAGAITFMPTTQTSRGTSPARPGVVSGVVGGVIGGTITAVTASPSPDRPPSNAMISRDGSYIVTLLSSGDYAVRVNAPNLNYQTTYTASSSATFDIDIRGALLRGHVVDAATGAPVANAQVFVNSRTTQSNGFATSDSDGHFAIDALADATFDLRVSREPFATATQQVVVSGGFAPEAEVRLEQAPAVTFHVVDSVTGAPVEASIVISTEQHTGPAQATRIDTGVYRSWLKPGTYLAAVFAPYYANKSTTFTTPQSDVQVSIVHGGRLIIQAKSAQQVRLNQIGARFPGPIREGTNGPYPPIPPGSYVLSLLDKSGNVVGSVPVVIVAGETTTIQLP